MVEDLAIPFEKVHVIPTELTLPKLKWEDFLLKPNPPKPISFDNLLSFDPTKHLPELPPQPKLFYFFFTLNTDSSAITASND